MATKKKAKKTTHPHTTTRHAKAGTCAACGQTTDGKQTHCYGCGHDLSITGITG